MLSAWIPYVLFAAVIVIGIPLWCWYADDNTPRSQEDPEDGDRDEPAEITAMAA